MAGPESTTFAARHESMWRGLALALVGLVAALVVFELTQTVHRQQNLGAILQAQQQALHQQALVVEGLRKDIENLHRKVHEMAESLQTLSQSTIDLANKVHGNSSMLGKLKAQQERWLERLVPYQSSPPRPRGELGP